MTSPRVDPASLPIDSVFQGMLVDLESLKARVAAYNRIAQDQQAIIAGLQRENNDLHREVARLKEAQAGNRNPARSMGSGRAQGRGFEPEVEALEKEVDGLRRQLRHSQKNTDSEDLQSPAQASIMASSPSVAQSQYRSLHMDPTDTSTPFIRSEATPKAPRTRRATQPIPSTSRSLSALEIVGETARPTDLPEQASPVRRTSKLDKAQLQESRSMDALDGVDLAGLSISSAIPPSKKAKRQKTKPSTEASNRESHKNGKERAGHSQESAVTQNREDPWETDHTYDGPEDAEDDLRVDGSSRQSAVAKGKRPEREAENAVPEPSQPDIQFMVDIFPEQSLRCGPIGQQRFLDKLGYDNEIINELDNMEGKTSFHLIVRGGHIFVADPIVLKSGADMFIVNWGDEQANERIRNAIWGEGRSSTATYHTFVRRIPGKKVEWYYEGKLRWSAADMPSKWPAYVTETRSNLSKVLQKRWKTTDTTNKIAIDVECDVFQQFTIKLDTTEELTAASTAFAEKKFRKAWINTQSSSAVTV
ncbi:hypothetical protein BDW22DRAFT_1351077 [Trametopsis cervina]|nr:hypothetical protein BDW22DRAFT_1351077 [Trametopsis cervina]